MSLLEKLGLPPRSADATRPAPAAKPPAPGAKTAAPARKKTVVPPPDATDGRRTRLDLNDSNDDATADAEPKKIRVDIVNKTGFELRRHALGTEDSEHVAYDAEPALKIADKGFTTVIAKAKGEDATGPAGHVDYIVGDKKGDCIVSMTWRHGASPVGKSNPNDGRFVVQAIRKGDDRFQYAVAANQGRPAADPAGPMRITIENFSGITLMLEKSGLDNAKAKLDPAPPSTIDGGDKAQFTVVAEDPEFPQTSGFADYRFTVDPPRDDNPSGQHKLSIAWDDDGLQIGSITPEAKPMEIEFGGNERNPVFTFFGTENEFKPPGKASEPTLRKGDKSADGWVEYLQELLNLKGAKLDIDGDFGGQTLKAVMAFQRKHKKEGVLEDGVVGDETWSFLRDGAPAKPKTDGRKPHSFVEKGNEARWVLEKGMPIYDELGDLALMQAVSVGDVDEIAKRIVRFRIVSPSGDTKKFERPIGEPFESSKTGQGSRHNISIRTFSELFGRPPVPGKPVPGDYKVTAYFPADLGGDTFDGVLNIPAP